MTRKSGSRADFLEQVMRLSAPIVSQQLLSAGLSLVDIIMVSSLGSTKVAAASIANQVFLIFAMCMAGVTSGASILISQRWGQSDLQGIHAYQGVCLLFGCCMALAFGLPSLLIPGQLVAIFSDDMQVIQIGQSYLMILSISFFAHPITAALTACLVSTRNAVVPLYISVATLSLNTLLNYALIFGKFGLPELGVTGAAIATSLSKFLECALMVTVVKIWRLPACASAKSMFCFSKVRLLGYVELCLPVLLNQLLYALGLSTYKFIFAKMGTHYLAAMTIVHVVSRLSFVILAGIASTCLVIVGNEVGSGQVLRARETSRRFIWIAIALSSCIAFFLFIFKEMIVAVFDVGRETSFVAENILAIACIFWVFRAISIIFNTGIFRAGGSTKVALYIDLGGMWLVGIPLSLSAAFVFDIDIYWVYILMSMEVVVQALICLNYFRKNRWIKNVAV